MKRKARLSDEAFGTSRPSVVLSDLAGHLVTKIAGIIHTQGIDKLIVTGSYDRDKARCEAKIAEALEALHKAGESGTVKDRLYDLGWAWHELEQAYSQLATITARYHLAKRRVELGIDQMDKDGRKEGSGGQR